MTWPFLGFAPLIWQTRDITLPAVKEPEKCGTSAAGSSGKTDGIYDPDNRVGIACARGMRSKFRQSAGLLLHFATDHDLS